MEKQKYSEITEPRYRVMTQPIPETVTHTLLNFMMKIVPLLTESDGGSGDTQGPDQDAAY